MHVPRAAARLALVRQMPVTCTSYNIREEKKTWQPDLAIAPSVRIVHEQPRHAPGQYASHTAEAL